MQFLMRNRAPLTVLMGMIAVAVSVYLILAIKNGSKEKMLGSAVVLGLLLIDILYVLIFLQ